MGEEFTLSVEKVRESMGVNEHSPESATSTLCIQNRKFIESYIVLEEFLKELASILQAKQNLKAIELMLNRDIVS